MFHGAVVCLVIAGSGGVAGVFPALAQSSRGAPPA